MNLFNGALRLAPALLVLGACTGDTNLNNETGAEDTGTPPEEETPPEETEETEETDPLAQFDTLYLDATYFIEGSATWENQVFSLGIGHNDATAAISGVSILLYNELYGMYASDTITVEYVGADGNVASIEEPTYSWDADFNPASLEMDVVVTNGTTLLGWFMFTVDCDDDDAESCPVFYLGAMTTKDGEVVEE